MSIKTINFANRMIAYSVYTIVATVTTLMHTASKKKLAVFCMYHTHIFIHRNTVHKK